MPPGSKPAPPGQSKRPDKQTKPWQPAPGVGWQHGDPADRRRKFPACPVGLLPQSELAWAMWFESWWASFWALEDLPGLAMTVALYDSLLRGTGKATDYHAAADRYGITPKGRQDLRWAQTLDSGKAEESPEATDEVAKRREARSKRVS